MKYRPDLDGIRALAVTLVLLYHTDYPLPGAFLGVDIFFTLSGYLITTIITTSLCEDTFNLKTFYIRRSLRLFPAALTVTTLTALTAIALLPIQPAVQTVVSAIAATVSLSNVRYLLQSGYFDTDSQTKPLLHTWSLAVEEQFYLVWPVLLLCAHRFLPPRSPLLLASIVVLLSPFLSHLLLQKHPAAAFYMAPARFYELLLGAALSYIPPPTTSLIPNVLGFAGLAGVCLSVACISATDPFPAWRALAPCLSTALLIHAGPLSFVSRLLSLRPLVFLGSISYSLYLVHWPVVVFYRLLVGQNGTFETGERLFMLGAALVLGYALNILVEKRFRISKRGNFDNTVITKEGAGETAPQQPSTSVQACRKLFVIILLVQISLLIAAAALLKLEIKPVWVAKDVPTVSGDSLKVFKDDYNGVDVDAVFQLKTEAETARSAPVRKRAMDSYSEASYFKNGSTDGWFAERPTPDMPRILFVGDSHAGHWKTLMYHLSRQFEAHVEKWHAPGCVLLFGCFNVFLKAPENTQPCRDTLKSWKLQLTKEPFDTVVISGRWAWLVEEDFYGNFGFKAHFLVDADAPEEKRVPPTSKEEWHAVFNESRRVLRKSLLETVDYITKLGSRVVLMNQVPLQDVNPVGCTSYPGAKAAIAVGRQPKRCVSVTRSQALARLRYFGEVMSEAKLRYGNMVDVVSPSDVFCDNYLQDQRSCRVVLGSFLLYRDLSHVSPLGAAFFAMRRKAMGYGGIPWSFRRPNKK